MVSTGNNRNQRPVWFVGAFYYYGPEWEDQVDRFLMDGIWENGLENGKFSDRVEDVQPGDRIALKSFFTQKNKPGLPFDDRGHYVSGMLIKATGTVTENIGDGRTLKVAWTPIEPTREWYFSTYMQTIHAVYPGDWKTDALIAFTFDDKPQDYDRWRNDPQYRERFGDRDIPTNDFQRTPSLASEGEQPAGYTIHTIIADGCFLDQSTLERMLQQLKDKQNLILQGPPGTGKTWLAKRLAYALVGQKDDSSVRQVQFHPNLSYEDFVRGWRPQGDGRLELVDGPFLKLCDTARQDPDGEYVMVIEEINRGNPASIFGELLTLLEADKRDPNQAMTLAYSRDENERFHIPPNVYVIGTMNLADRSLAMVDFALRRRFAFFDLEPMLNDAWRDWVHEQSGIDGAFLDEVAQRVNALNEEIAADRNLGPQFRIGHSFVTPAPGTSIEDPEEWFTQVVETEIVTLLHEYWFDDPQKVDDAKSALLNNLR